MFITLKISIYDVYSKGPYSGQLDSILADQASILATGQNWGLAGQNRVQNSDNCNVQQILIFNIT